MTHILLGTHHLYAANINAQCVLMFFRVCVCLSLFFSFWLCLQLEILPDSSSVPLRVDAEKNIEGW